MPLDTTRAVTAAVITRSLMLRRYRRNFVLPNYTPEHWWEMDLFEVTDAGLLREYEVKVSRADFGADSRKKKPDLIYQLNGEVQILEGSKKHDQLARADTDGPTRFWYVAPTGLLLPQLLPHWAGLIEISPTRSGRLSEKEIVKAPMLHREKFDGDAYQKAVRSCYWRLHAAMNGRPNAGVEDEASLEWVI